MLMGSCLVVGHTVLVRTAGVRILSPQPSFTFCKIIRGFPGALRLPMVFFRYNPGIFKVTGQHAVGKKEVPALKRRENKVFKNQSFFFRLWRKVLSVFLLDCPKANLETIWTI